MSQRKNAQDQRAELSKVRARAGRIGAHRKWGTTVDRAAATSAARTAFDKRFDDQVPAEVVDPKQRAAMAESLRKEYFSRLAHRSAEARRLARKAIDDLVNVEAELNELAS